ncbi:glycosyltransferase family protein [Paraburkholderia tropica]|uniref:mannosyltransferase n=1 Tax=Paraburkholderia tropica TaxID=92647 RepID=UPI002AAFC1D0|nr:mannosyltransferase [Paraburkholderia tropica]
MKRILLTTSPNAFLYRGGGEQEILLLNEFLNASGVMSDIYGPTSRSLSAYDHVIHFSMQDGSELLVDALAGSGRHLILWPNLWFMSPPHPQHLERLARLLARFDAVIFKSQAEEAHFARYLSLEGKQVIRLAPLISPRFLRKQVSKVFQDSYGLDRYAIWPGIIEPQKNQLAAVEAFRDLDINLVISGAVRDTGYAERCREAAGGNVTFVPVMPFGSELHLSALAHSSLFVELALDFPGTSALEAAAMGCRLLLSQTDWTREMLDGQCVQVDPHDVAQIRAGALEALGQATSTEAKFSALPMNEAVAPLLRYLDGSK